MMYFVPRKNLLGRPGNNSPSPRTNVPRLTILVTNNGLKCLSNNFVGSMFPVPHVIINQCNYTIQSHHTYMLH